MGSKGFCLSLGFVLFAGCAPRESKEEIGRGLGKATKGYADLAEALANDPKNDNMREKVKKSKWKMEEPRRQIIPLPYPNPQEIWERINPELKKHSDRAKAALAKV